MDSQILGKTQDHHFILGDAIQLGPNSVYTHHLLEYLDCPPRHAVRNFAPLVYTRVEHIRMQIKSQRV